MLRLSTLLLLLMGSASAQQAYFYLPLHFDTDKSTLTSAHIQALDSLWDHIGGHPIDHILLRGHTDSIASGSYNLALSERRARSIWEYLRIRGVSDSLITVRSLGEEWPIASNGLPRGRAVNRRAEIIVYMPYTPVEVSQRGPASIRSRTEKAESGVPEIIFGSDCLEDTTIFLENGTAITLNFCDYYLHRICLELEMYRSTRALYEASQDTLSSQAEPLVIGGAFRLQDCASQPWKYPISIHIPVPDSLRRCQFLKGLSFWSPNNSGNWSERPEINECSLTSLNRRMYYSVSLSADSLRQWQGWGNMAMRRIDAEQKGYIKSDGGGVQKEACRDCPGIRVKVKSPRGLNLQTVSFSTGCPLTTYHLEPLRARTFVGRLPCKDQPYWISAMAQNEAGDSVTIRMRIHHQLPHRRLFGGCRVGSDAGLASRDKALFRKYLLGIVEMEEENLSVNQETGRSLSAD